MRLDKDTRDFARDLRRGSTDAERLLWSRLRGRRLLGLRFRRQHPIDRYFVDFACLEIGLIIELDGGQHAAPANRQRDAARTAVLEAHGFKVLRFWDNEILRELDAVLTVVASTAALLCSKAGTDPHPYPLPAKPGEGSEPDA